MAKVQFRRIEDSADIDDVAVVDGQFIVTKDGKIYIDYGNTRSEISGSGGGGGGSSAPIGTMAMFAGSTAPDGWLICDGSAISRTTYSQLFNKIGTTYGTGDGSTTFNIPNFKGRVPVGLDSTQTEFDTLGETGGEKTHTLIEAEIPEKIVGTNAGNAISDGFIGRGDYSVTNTFNFGGNGQAHNNLQPYAVTNVIIKAIEVQTSTTAVESLPIGSILEYDGVTAPEGYEEIEDKEVILYNNTTGSTGNITLSDNVNNYRYIEIYFKTNDDYYGYKKIIAQNCNTDLVGWQPLNVTDTTLYGKYRVININNNVISTTDSTKYQEVVWNHDGSMGYLQNNYIYITRVVGLK